MKQERRRYYRGLQASFAPEQYRQWNEALGPNLIRAIRESKPESFVAVYQARPKEADLSPLFSLPYKFCFPKVLGEDGRMEFRHVPGANEFQKGAFGILEPLEKHSVIPKKEIAACFVPLLAFDAEGRRLGHGKGFYDRFLENFPGRRIGVGFEWQFSPAPLPVDAHDVLLHCAVTEHGIRSF